MSVVETHAPLEQYVVAGCRRPYPDFLPVVAQRCRQQPDRVAVVASDGRLTYRELAVRVSGMARGLAASGVTAGSLVAICMPRGADELTAMLAVLTLGAAYVPLDPTQPAARLATIVADSRPDLLIAKGARSVPVAASVRTIDVASDALTSSPAPSWEPQADPDSLAYVLFTSGSTGRPKGVEIPRRAVSNLLSSVALTPGLRQSDVLLAVATSMFDMAVLDLFGPLYVGATVRIADSDVVKDGHRLRELLEREPITVMQATPTLWHMLLDSGWVGDHRLRMLVGGEALSPDLARNLLQHGELWNMYGPTEATVWSACKRIERSDDITIGRPIDNTEICVLDQDGNRLPPGIVGELCIGGAGLARGYLGRPDLTAQRFIDKGSGGLIYRTGDLARQQGNGEFVCLGRLDHQVKIRGFRIELGEIEHALDELDCVSRAVVTKWESITGTATLVAYVVPSPGAEFDPRELSRLLRDRLPSYMIPGRYIAMSSFPTTPNEKIDRAALPDPAEAQPLSEPEVGRAPRTNTERLLLRIWAEILDRQGIAVDDDFFDLGGQSVLAARICDRIHRQFAVELPLSAMLENRTVEDLSAYIDGRRDGSWAQRNWSTLVPIQPNGCRSPIFCVSGVGGNPMTFVDLADELGPEQPFYGLQHRGVDGRRRPHSSIEAMAGEFVDDIRSLQHAGPYVLAGYSGGGLAAFEMAQQLVRAGQQVDLVILFDTIRPGLAGWSRRQRAKIGWRRLKALGPGYIAHRLADRTNMIAGESAKRLRAALAALSPYRFRLEAVEMAARKAEAAYEPQPYRGRVLLFQSDPDIGSEMGVPPRQHESNGWRELVGANLEVVAVHAGHLGIFDGEEGRFVASEVTRFLRSKAPVGNGEAQ